jgi:hypothetical protein
MSRTGGTGWQLLGALACHLALLRGDPEQAFLGFAELRSLERKAALRQPLCRRLSPPPATLRPTNRGYLIAALIVAYTPECATAGRGFAIHDGQPRGGKMACTPSALACYSSIYKMR